MYLGTGTNFAGVRRAYDEFLEQNLRNSNSDVATQEPLVTYTNRVVDVLGSDTVGLPPAMDKFLRPRVLYQPILLRQFYADSSCVIPKV